MIGITSIVIITANIVVVTVNIIICIGTTCISSEPNVGSASPGYFTYTASSKVENLFTDIITNQGPSARSEGKKTVYFVLIIYFNTIFQIDITVTINGIGLIAGVIGSIFAVMGLFVILVVVLVFMKMK